MFHQEDEMKLKLRTQYSALAGLALLSILISACASGSSTTEPTPAQEVVPSIVPEEVQQGEDDQHSPVEHMGGEHVVPEEAAAIPNPIAVDEESLAAGAEVYAASCALCHGVTGEGDGPAAAGLEMPPADLHADHVQALSDGALFFIISHGKPDTPMPAWEDVLDEGQRWRVVNFLRTFLDS